MDIQRTPIPDVFVIDLVKRADERGFFARAFCAREFAEAGLEGTFVQVNNSASVQKGTLRGLHYQVGADAEVKLVRCIKGALYDVVLDMRPASPTFGQWYGAEISAENRRMMYVPRGFAHAFITLTDDVEAFYFSSAFYAPGAERGVRWNDPRFAIEWPIAPTVLSDKDASWPLFDPDYHFAKAA